jgi:hypothetical protein
MRIVNLLGLTMFFYLGIRYNIYISFLIYINGIIYHTNENNNLIKLYDLISNILIALYLSYNCFDIIIYSLFTLTIYLINSFLYKKKYISRFLCDIIHVFGVMTPSCYSLYIYNNFNITQQ